MKFIANWNTIIIYKSSEDTRIFNREFLPAAIPAPNFYTTIQNDVLKTFKSNETLLDYIKQQKKVKNFVMLLMRLRNL